MGHRITRLRLSADKLQRMLPRRSEKMKSGNGSSSDITNLKPSDHQVFFEALESPSLPTEALRVAFLRQKESLGDPDANTPFPD